MKNSTYHFEHTPSSSAVLVIPTPSLSLTIKSFYLSFFSAKARNSVLIYFTLPLDGKTHGTSFCDLGSDFVRSVVVMEGGGPTTVEDNLPTKLKVVVGVLVGGVVVVVVVFALFDGKGWLLLRCLYEISYSLPIGSFIIAKW